VRLCVTGVIGAAGADLTVAAALAVDLTVAAALAAAGAAAGAGRPFPVVS